MRRFILLIPVLFFAGLTAIFFNGLSSNPSALPSALINRPVPEFSLPAIATLDVPGLKTTDLQSGTLTVVNIWASWCGPCRAEHPVLMELTQRTDIKLVGINNKDDPTNAARFLATLGQPFAAVGSDLNGRATIDWGGYGVPETFIIDGQGIIRYKHIGPLTESDLIGSFNTELEKAKTPLN